MLSKLHPSSSSVPKILYDTDNVFDPIMNPSHQNKEPRSLWDYTQTKYDVPKLKEPRSLWDDAQTEYDVS